MGQGKALRQRLEGRFEIKTKVVGLGKEESREARVLNRIIRATSAGWQYEPDQRHAEMIISEMGLEGSKSVKSPGEPESKNDEKAGTNMSGHDGTRFRGMVASRAMACHRGGTGRSSSDWADIWLENPGW